MFIRPFEIYEDNQIVPKPILTDSAKNAIKFYVQDLSESIPYVWAHEDLLFTIYSQSRPVKEPQRNS